MWSSRHPLWQAGFRPFFPLAALAALLLPGLWVGVLHGAWTLPAEARPALHWHAHEMFYGFGGAVLVGFLLTASKNWTSSSGYRGPWLMALVGLWLLDRYAMLGGQGWPQWAQGVALLAFPALAVGMLLATLWRHRAYDGFAADNRYFLIGLPLLLPAKWLIATPEHFASGEAMSLAIFRLAFLLMLERTLPAFLQGGLQRAVQRQPRVDAGVRLLALLLCFAPFLPGVLAVGLALALAALLLWRLPGWHIGPAMRRPELGIMFVGYLSIVLQLFGEAAEAAGFALLPHSLNVHLFALGALGCIVPAMFIRIAHGHTGRRIVFGPYERTIMGLAVLALLARVLGPWLWPAAYLGWLDLAATAWGLAFALWLRRCLPYVWRARADGREG